MDRITHTLQQGSQSWHNFRREHFGASEAAACMNLSPYQSRAELLRIKATGEEKEIPPALQAVFDRGHETEIGGRAIAEGIIGEELYPVVMSYGKLSASCDGLTMLGDVAFEHKQWNADLARSIAAGILPDHHMPQVQQVMLVTGAERCMFMTSDGTQEHCAWMWVPRDPDYMIQVQSAWNQFSADLSEYVPPEVVPAPTAAPQMQLPAVSVNVTGAIAVTDNLRTFGDALQAYVERINKQPQTDDDFATLEAQAKDLKRAEDALTTAEDNALGQAADIDTLRKTVSHLREIARQARLSAEKIVKAEKENRKNAIIQKGIEGFRAFRDELTRRFPAELPMTMPDVPADFYGAAKGLKTLTSIQNAINTELARVKIDASAAADKIAGNLRILLEHEEHRHLFADYRMLAIKDADDLLAVIEQRISAFAEHEARKKQESEVAEQKRSDDAASSKTIAPIIAAEVAARTVASPPQSDDTGTRIKLGEIGERLGFTLTAEFL
ncbi:MAG: YqaJ viral recombinase family protein, partial [Betaproteobacteria bacterium]|nr:YqaJ viral recombinase family protein [Betaproteobacteria bacterium]